MRPMCRLFGFRSILPSRVHRSVVAADSSIARLSREHRDGWGVAYYVDGVPHLTKSPTAAFDDQIFHRLSGVVRSQTVLAHVRRATVGARTVLNTHPFQYGRWVFAHNGEIARFDEHREALLEEVDPALRPYILGETDSEVLFYLLLTALRRDGHESGGEGVERLADAVRRTTDLVRTRCDRASGASSNLTVIVTDGRRMLGAQGGRELHWSTYKTRCPEREHCPYLARSCEAAAAHAEPVNHLLFASQPLSGENVWIAMQPGEIVAVDGSMRLHRWPQAAASIAFQST
ncbi:MAG: class II glutamine amidotransferase [Myxococcota bacterium]|nr:class II glutamine amidotransferase [Myxococcota bacterium]MDW8361352.1 class II glutamine amidotransferase [Myxococcales bacterium]